MAAPARRSRHDVDIWPGFVDALATLLMVIIFLLMIFIVSQFYLNDALLGRDKALESLNQQVAELAELLDLERKSNTGLRRDLAELSSELQSSLSQRDEMQSQVTTLGEQLASAKRALTEQSEDWQKKLEEANRTVRADKETIEIQIRKLAALEQDIIALEALKKKLEEDLEDTRTTMESGRNALAAEREISAAAQAQVALLNQQMAALRAQIAQLNAALEASEVKDKEQEAKIADLGKRLNAALARKVQELSRYRSEFFGRLRVVLGNRPDIRVVGDRFVFQSEILFASGSAELGKEGKEQMARLAATLKDIAKKIPPEVDWVLRIDGHTDDLPINTTRFPSNWELSTARAISVVKFLISQGIPPGRLAAAGFGEFQPLDTKEDEISRRRNRRIEMKLDQR
ncbi:MAG: peptidoglycan -binding protein [Gammaproteobacteria bacterium]|jgi:chemotaxis protein MotB